MTQFVSFIKQLRFQGTDVRNNVVVDIFEKLGFKNVVSVLVTGNIIFEAAKNPSKIIIDTLRAYYNYNDLDIWTLPAVDVQKIYNGNPYKIKKENYIQCFICNDGFGKVLLDEFDKMEHEVDEIATINEGYFYWQCPKQKDTGIITSRFAPVLSKSKYKHNFTIRTIGTIEKVWRRCVGGRSG